MKPPRITVEVPEELFIDMYQYLPYGSKKAIVTHCLQKVMQQIKVNPKSLQTFIEGRFEFIL